MLQAAEEALSFIHKKNRKHLEHNRQLLLSLIKEIEIIGEAASKVTPSFRKQYSDIPWEIIVGTRNRLIHVYFDIDYDVVWKTVTDDLPALVRQLRAILEAEEDILDTHDLDEAVKGATGLRPWSKLKQNLRVSKK